MIQTAGPGEDLTGMRSIAEKIGRRLPTTAFGVISGGRTSTGSWGARPRISPTWDVT